MAELRPQNLDFGSNTVTIADGETESVILDTLANVITGIIAPSSFGGASLTLLVGADKDNVDKPLFNPDGTPFTLTIAADQAVIVIPQFVAGWQFIKLVANAAQAGSDADMLVFGRPI